MSTRILARLIFFFFKILSVLKMFLFQELRCVTTVIPWLSFWRRHFNVRYVTCSHGADCHAELPAGRVHCLKMAKIDPVSPFYPTLWLKQATLQWENLQKVRKTSLEAVNIYFCAFRNWKCLHNNRRPTVKIPELRWCLTEISFNNPSQFPGMF